MKWRAFIPLFALLAISQLKAQISEGGLPPSFNYTTSLRSEIAAVDIPVTFNVEDLIQVDEWRVSAGSPLKVANILPVNLTMENSGQWSVLPSGERIWQLRVQAEGAIALMLYYKVFDIPLGGRLFIYNADKSQILGAYTKRTNPGKGRFATEFVAGDDVILEYVSSSSEELPRIEIEEIAYGYNHLTVTESVNFRSTSGSCMVNINCSEGAAWQKEKAGVCGTVQKIGDGSYICSGSLVNNTAEDFKPYVLMAYHCMESLGSRANITEISSPEDMKQWLFYFNYERQGCTTSLPAYSRTMTGCSKVVSTPINGGSDGLLVLLDQEIPEEYNVYYNGWDRRNIQPQSGVGIHHPGSDYKKISTYTSKPEHATWFGDDSSTGARSAHWDVVFDATENGHGVTEGGSSGSPLFNQDHLIVGTLTGGTSSCNYPQGGNLYGKLYYHWNKALSDTAHMGVWLDPLGKGVETLKGISRTAMKPGATDLQLTYNNKSVTLSWKTPVSSEKPSHYNIYRTNQLIGTSAGNSYTDDNVNIWGEVIYSVTAEYSTGDESLPLTGSIRIQEFKAPSNLNVEQGNSVVSLNWTAPLYEQTISWATGSPSFMLGMGPNSPIYFGHLWGVEDLEALNNNTIKAVEFYVDKDAVYSLLILQGEREYKQAVVSPENSSIQSVSLTTPFVINSSEELIIAIKAVTTKENVYPMACDPGPAVIGKGNLISEDGQEWFVLYDGVNGEEYDANFYLGTVVSSEKGTINKFGLRSSKSVNTAFSSPLQQSFLSTRSFRAANTESSDYQYPAAFPDVTGYNVYRGSTLLTPTPQKTLVYADRQPPSGNHVYGVTAVYSGEESEKLLSSGIPVSNEIISSDAVVLSPSIFTDYVRITNVDRVNRVDIYAITGVRVRRINAPESTIITSDLPTGVYIFRLYTDDGIKTYQTIKK